MFDSKSERRMAMIAMRIAAGGKGKLKREIDTSGDDGREKFNGQLLEWLDEVEKDVKNMNLLEKDESSGMVNVNLKKEKIIKQGRGNVKLEWTMKKKKNKNALEYFIDMGPEGGKASNVAHGSINVNSDRLIDTTGSGSKPSPGFLVKPGGNSLVDFVKKFCGKIGNWFQGKKKAIHDSVMNKYDSMPAIMMHGVDKREISVSDND